MRSLSQHGPGARAGRQVAQPKWIARGLTIGAIIVLAGFVVAEAHSLWKEWHRFRVEIGGASRTQVIGYLDIAPLASLRRRARRLVSQRGRSVAPLG